MRSLEVAACGGTVAFLFAFFILQWFIQFVSGYPLRERICLIRKRPLPADQKSPGTQTGEGLFKKKGRFHHLSDNGIETIASERDVKW